MRFLFLLYFSINQLWAVGEAGAIFLLIAPGAGPQGSGEAQVAKANDAYASYYNPAGLGFLKGREAAGMHVNWLPNLASDLYYEFITYRHYIEGLGSVGGHLIYLNLGEQIGMDEFGNPTENWSSYMAAMAGSFGTQLSKTSAIGFNFKIFHQKLSINSVGNEEGNGYSTDFAFDIGYLKKFKRDKHTIKIKKQKKLNRFFDQFENIYNRQNELSNIMQTVIDTDQGVYEYIEGQTFLLEDIGFIVDNFEKYNSMINYTNLNIKLLEVKDNIFRIVESFEQKQEEEAILSSLESFADSNILLMDNILSNILEFETYRQNFIDEVDSEEIENIDDKLNFGFSISNIGPKIDFVDVEQADPSPTNMRMGIFAQLYDDGFNKVNFLFDSNKLLVTRYPMMDWDGDGIVGGYDEYGANLGAGIGEYNSEGKKEYDSKGYIDDPWYLAIITAWLDDWYLGGDIDYDGDGRIGGYNWDESMDADNDGEPDIEEMVADENGIYNEGDVNGNVEIEKGTGNNRSISKEFTEMIYNVGLEYWYSDSFALRAGYIYDYEGKVFNPTFGAGIRLLQYGFDFGYTAGDQGHPRANTMFFSINMEI